MESPVVEISKNFFLYRSPEKDFHRNIYLKKFSGNGQVSYMIFDPGTESDVGNIFDGFGKIMGGINNINLISNPLLHLL